MIKASGVFVLIALFIALVFARPQDIVPELKDLPILPTVLLLALLAWIFGPRTPERRPVLVFLFGLWISISLSMIGTGWLGGTLKVFLDFAPNAMIFVLLSTTLVNLRRFRILFLMLITINILVVLDGHLQINYGNGWTGITKQIDNRIRYAGIFFDPNDLGLSLCCTFSMALYFARKNSLRISKAFAYLTMPVLVYGIYLTNSRGTILGLVTVLLVHLSLKYKWYISFVVLPPLLAGFVLFAPSRSDTLDDESSRGRIDAWYEGFEMLKANPVFGVGKGMFTDIHHITAHNSFVLAFSELGLVGYFFWFTLVLSSIVLLIDIIQKSKSSPPSAKPAIAISELNELRDMAATLLATCAGLLACSFFLSRTYIPVLFVVLSLAVGLSMLSESMTKTPQKTTLSLAKLGAIHTATSIVALWIITKIALKTTG